MDGFMPGARVRRTADPDEQGYVKLAHDPREDGTQVVLVEFDNGTTVDVNASVLEFGTLPGVTPATMVMVTMKGEKHVYTIGSGGSHAIEAWANTLEDLTGYKAAFLTEKMVEGLTRRYSMEFETAAGDLCPIRFLVTKA